MAFSVPITVRGYELDVNGHLNQAVYLQYFEHARWELLRAGGVPGEKAAAAGIGPVVLEQTIKYLRELHLGDEVTVSCEFEWTGGKIFHMRQQIVKLDGTVSARVDVVAGMLDLKARKLVADPGAALRALAGSPDLLGL
ncbi:acyl-CoA thioesterase [Nocardia yunnanensis]|uniref:Acyl-CoA thioesterase n=1 Tax=Nocardia yunnanensis TaxID=2382165 RepID=A0A386ZC71_9NOCA|nr:thioesterase family protein [Nocardia yunnanensis]AYF75452.1 acyl-CoA thioesterase [Nocardia yunnanensis]